MRACLEFFKKDSEILEYSVKAEQYLKKIDDIIGGGTVLLSSADYLELHKFVISIYASILDKGQVTDQQWTSKQWENVLKHIERCYEGKPATFEVTQMCK